METTPTRSRAACQSRWVGPAGNRGEDTPSSLAAVVPPRPWAHHTGRDGADGRDHRQTPAVQDSLGLPSRDPDCAPEPATTGPPSRTRPSVGALCRHGCGRLVGFGLRRWGSAPGVPVPAPVGHQVHTAPTPLPPTLATSTPAPLPRLYDGAPCYDPPLPTRPARGDRHPGGHKEHPPPSFTHGTGRRDGTLRSWPGPFTG